MSAIEQKLDELAELMAQKDLLVIQKKALLDSVLTPEIKAKLAEIEAEFAEPAAAVEEKIADLDASIREAALTEGKSIRGAHLAVVFSKGRTSWDSKILEGMMKLIPQIGEAKKEGEASVSIRKV